jgi:hypothetical protein
MNYSKSRRDEIFVAIESNHPDSNPEGLPAHKPAHPALVQYFSLA